VTLIGRNIPTLRLQGTDFNNLKVLRCSCANYLILRASLSLIFWLLYHALTPYIFIVQSTETQAPENTTELNETHELLAECGMPPFRIFAFERMANTHVEYM